MSEPGGAGGRYPIVDRLKAQASGAPLDDDTLVRFKSLAAPLSEDDVDYLPRVWCRDCREARRGGSGVCGRHTKRRCELCSQNITTGHIDIPYGGHAAVTERLNDVDPYWTWEPFAVDEAGLPAVVDQGNLVAMWGRLTVLGVTRPEVGTCDKGKDEVLKEIVGDFIRRGAMRFGVGLDLWRKGDQADRRRASVGVEVPAETNGSMGAQREPSPDAMRDTLESIVKRRGLSGEFVSTLIKHQYGAPSGKFADVDPERAERLLKFLDGATIEKLDELAQEILNP